MPWSNQGGGPWGGGSGGSGGGGSGGPWGGQRPTGGGGAGGPTPPNLEEMLRRGQDRFRNMMPGGIGSGRGILLILLAVLVLWGVTGFYRVQPDQQGVQLLFGKWDGRTTQPGLHYWFPSPIGEVQTPSVERINRVDIGFRGASESDRVTSQRDVPKESLMLTGDQNIADVDLAVLWRIRDAGDFLFNIRAPEDTVKKAAESAVREVVGQTQLEALLTGGRQQVEQTTRDLLQEILDSYGAGILIQGVQLQKVDPPSPVIDAFNDVQRARQDKERLQNQAEAYANRIVPTARGEAAKIIEDANAYRERVTKEAEGEAEKFVQIYEAYKTAPEVTRRRMYLETIRDVIGGANKVIIDQDSQGAATQGVVPYLPLNELRRNGAAATTVQGTSP